MTTPPTTLHERLAAELTRRTAVANAAGTPPPPDPAADWQAEATPIKDVYRVVDGDGSLVADMLVGEELAAHIALHDSADALRRYAGELDVLERHAIVWRDIGWLEDGDERYEELPVCGRCVPKHSHFRTRAEVPVGACDETKGVASRLGVSVDG